MQGLVRQRHVRIDFWRGMALLTIFVNHIPGNVFERLTHKNFGFSDAAELFVLLAGYSAALAYFPAFMAGHQARQVLSVLMRVATLYTAHIVTLLLAAALFFTAAFRLGDPRIIEYANLRPVLAAPAEALVGIVTLGHHLAYFDILPLYVVLLLMLPGMMWLARSHWVYVLGVSAALYLCAQIMHLNMPRYPGQGGWFFNPFTWQFLFAIGFAAGAVARGGAPLPYHRGLYIGACAYLAAALVWVLARVTLSPDALPLPRFLWSFDKQNLSLPRLTHALALVYVLAHLPVGRWLARMPSLEVVAVLGRHALPVFCIGSLLSALAQMLRVALGGGIGLDVLLIAAGIAVQLALAWVLEWHKQATRRPQPAAVAPSDAALHAS